MSSSEFSRVGFFVLLTASVSAFSGGGGQPVASGASAERVERVLDLSHRVTTFLPSTDTAPERRFTADMKRPVGASRVVAGFQDQAVLVQAPDFPSGVGVFKLNSIVLPENLGTSVDSAAHFVPTKPEVPAPDRRSLSELTVAI